MPCRSRPCAVSFSVFSLPFVLSSAFSGRQLMPATIAANALAAHTPDLANGKIMFQAGGCAACHVPVGEQDRTRLGGGYEIKTRFGSFFTPNISPEPKDGIGAWSEADFVTAMWKGTSPDGRHYFPAFPYPSYQHMRSTTCATVRVSQDAAAGAGRAPDHGLRFPYNIRRRRAVEDALSRRQGPSARPDADGAMESRRLSSQGPGALRGMSFAA